MNVVILGASKGIGRQLMFEALLRNFNVVGIARSKFNEIKDISDNPRLNYISSDITDLSNIHELTGQLLRLMPTIDVVLNCIGILINKPFVDNKGFDIQQVVNTNFIGPATFFSSLMASKKLEACHFVNITSMGGVQGSVKFPGLSYYSAAKGAMNILTECLAEEFKGTKHRFNALALGAVQTEMLEEAFPGYKTDMTPEKIARYILGFACNSGEFMNGKILQVSTSTP